ncbi:hypothetical protein PHYPO_G00116910 [Pangasianodon hypophthalmus]|uniref:G-protein coupled receptors family 1 profile domain-containing protein n=1 Tax=Pangasianodon hypophthalmus TaxID=310915 RepID=A0A5N5L3E8_PANHP|nr:hypothetical protein PHYPO_G00116910 [Pangasianodon hypophthalmus]
MRNWNERMSMELNPTSTPSLSGVQSFIQTYFAHFSIKMDNETDWLPEHCTVKVDLVSRRIGLFLLHLFLFIVGLIMNLMVVWVNWQRRRTRNTVIFCILNMGVADTMLMLILPISMPRSCFGSRLGLG